MYVGTKKWAGSNFILFIWLVIWTKTRLPLSNIITNEKGGWKFFFFEFFSFWSFLVCLCACYLMMIITNNDNNNNRIIFTIMITGVKNVFVEIDFFFCMCFCRLSCLFLFTVHASKNRIENSWPKRKKIFRQEAGLYMRIHSMKTIEREEKKWESYTHMLCIILLKISFFLVFFIFKKS